MKNFLITFLFLIFATNNILLADECVSGNCVNGQGTYKHANGEYVGEFKDGKANGQGTATSADGQVKYVGEFKDGQSNGYGKLVQDEKVYEGMWKNGKLISK